MRPCRFPTLQNALRAIGGSGTVYARAGDFTPAATTRIRGTVSLEGGNTSCAPDPSGNSLSTINLADRDFRMLYVAPGASLTVSNMTLIGGRHATNGGTIRVNNAELNLVNTSVFSGMTAGQGGCISAVGSVINVAEGSTIADCTATGDAGGVLLLASRLRLSGDSEIRGNMALYGSGGNILADTQSVLAVRGNVRDGFAARNGGGIANCAVASF